MKYRIWLDLDATGDIWLLHPVVYADEVTAHMFKRLLRMQDTNGIADIRVLPAGMRPDFPLEPGPGVA